MKIKVFSILLLAVFFLGSCESTEKILKSKDSNFKYTKALEWYNKGQYYKAIPVFEELMGLYKGSKTTEEIYYYYCMAQFKQRNYILSAYHFKNYVTQHPYSDYTEEALFMHAESYYKQSPKVSLEQTNTKKAIDAYQVFINQYPSSDRLPTCNRLIDELRDKLEQKALSAAALYYRTKNYRAAAVSYANLLVDFPDIEGERDIQYKIVTSYHLYAQNSVVNKQQERFEETIKAAESFYSRYPESDYTEKVVEVKEDAHLEAIKASYNLALAYVPAKKVKKLEDVKDVYEVHESKLLDLKNKELAAFILEQSYFEMIKGYFNLAQNSGVDERKNHYVSTIQAYNTFKNQYSSSKFVKEATRINNAAQKNLKKLING